MYDVIFVNCLLQASSISDLNATAIACRLGDDTAECWTPYRPRFRREACDGLSVLLCVSGGKRVTASPCCFVCFRREARDGLTVELIDRVRRLALDIKAKVS